MLGAVPSPEEIVLKYAVLGDIHANRPALAAVLEEAARLRVDAFVSVGDIVGYGAEPSACVAMLRELDGLIVVQGNHDEMAAGDRILDDINPNAAAAMKWTREQLSADEREWLRSLPLTLPVGADAIVVHASPDDPAGWHYVLNERDVQDCFDVLESRICFYGHVHIPFCFREAGSPAGATYAEVGLDADDRYLINVGSVGQPRDEDPRAALVVYDDLLDIVTMHRVEYDIAEAQLRILDAGLPSALAERLILGR